MVHKGFVTTSTTSIAAAAAITATTLLNHLSRMVLIKNNLS